MEQIIFVMIGRDFGPDFDIKEFSNNIRYIRNIYS